MPNSRFFELIDTGGIGMVDRDDLSEHVERQIDSAITEADLILFVVDIRDELMPLDEEVAAPAPLRADARHPGDEQGRHARVRHRGGEFYKLGRGKPIAVSTHQNRNKQALLEADRQDAPRGDATPPSRPRR